MKRCLAPCVKDLCKPAEYQQATNDVKLLLEGKNTELADELEQRMWHFAETEKYELAAKYRDLRRTVRNLANIKKWSTTADKDVDMFGFYREKQRLALQLFTMREGRMIGRREFFWEDLDAENFDASEFLGEILSQYYSTDYVPLEIHVPQDFEDRETFGKGFDRKTRAAEFTFYDPKRGQKREMISLVETNAKIAFEQRFRVLKPDTRKGFGRIARNSRIAAFSCQNREF